MPAVLAENAGAPLLSYARFKGPTRLSLSNLFGLIPAPLRARWHGPNMTHLARVCCALARLYGSIFELYGVVIEGLEPRRSAGIAGASTEAAGAITT
ncbi:MAG: hypothetical protein R2748_18985 [Bryobacterales bacterium]